MAKSLILLLLASTLFMAGLVFDSADARAVTPGDDLQGVQFARANGDDRRAARAGRQRGRSAGGSFDGTRWNNPGGRYPEGWSHHTYSSSGHDIGYTLYLPPAYDRQPQARFPVIYMLHGRGGNENLWAGFFSPDDCIIVGVNGGRNSKYMDAASGSPMFGVVMMETSVLELVAHIDATYRTKANSGGRAIQGFSMGGFGAFRLGFKHPEMWSSIYTFSAAVNDTAEGMAAHESPFVENMLGGNAELFEPERAQTLASTNTGKIIASGIHIKGAIGGNDDLKRFNVKMYEQLTELGIPNEGLTIVPGYGHDKSYAAELDPIGWARKWFR